MDLPVLPTIKSVTDLRYQTADIMKTIDQGQPVIITRDNDSIAVILSPRQYQQIINLLEESEERKEIKKLEKAIRSGGKFANFSAFDKKQRKKLKIANV